MSIFAYVIANRISHGIGTALSRSKTRFDAAALRYDTWFLVLLAILFTIAAVLVLAMAGWCVMFERKHFTGHFRLGFWGIDANIECR